MIIPVVPCRVSKLHSLVEHVDFNLMKPKLVGLTIDVAVWDNTAFDLNRTVY